MGQVAASLTVVLGSVLLGRAVGTGSWSVFFLILLAVTPVVAVLLGSRLLGMGVLALCALPLFSQSYRLPLMWAVIVLWLFVVIAERVLGRLPRSGLRLGAPERWLPAAFFGSALLADALGSENHVQDVVSKTVALLFGLMVYYLVSTVFVDPSWHRRALVSLSSGALIVMGLGVLMFVRPGVSLPGMISLASSSVTTELGQVTVRLAGPLGDYELLAEMLSLSAIALFALAMGGRGRSRAVYAVLGAMSVGGMLLTGTRGAVIVFAFGLLLLLIKRGRGATATAVPYVVLVAGAAVAGFVALFPDTSAVFGRLAQIQLGGPVAVTFDRGSVWPGFVARISSSAGLLFGHGAEYDYLSIGTYPHSLYLYVLYTQGILGLVIMAVFLFRLATPIIAVLRERVPWTSLSIGPVLAAMFLLDQVKIEFMRVYPYQMWVWALLGLVAVGTRIRSAESHGMEPADV